MSAWSIFVEGMEVKPRETREAFWRWEHACERRTRDIWGGLVVMVVGGGREGGQAPDGRE